MCKLVTVLPHMEFRGAVGEQRCGSEELCDKARAVAKDLFREIRVLRNLAWEGSMLQRGASKADVEGRP